MLDTRTSWIGKALCQLPDTLVHEAIRIGQRPTIRALLYESGHKHHQKVASYRVARMRNASHKVFTLVGGEVRAGEGWQAALQRELREELRACSVAPALLKKGQILAMETVSTRRQHYQGKLVIVVGVAIPQRKFHEENLSPTGTEITDLKIGSITDTANRLRQLQQHTPEEMRMLYQAALSQLREQCS